MKSILGALLVLGASVVHATNHLVIVAQNKTLTYTPNQLTADVNDTITFQFVAGNHSVAQSTFAQPCVPNGGIWSGFEFVQPAAVASSSAAASSTPGYSSGYKEKRGQVFPEFTITINTTSPLWFYCAQAMHCQSGMVMAVNVNATTNKTLAAYEAAASSATANVIPTFAAQGGVQSDVTSTPSASAQPSAGSSGTSGASFNGAGFTTMFVVSLLALFGGLMAAL